MTEWLPQIIPTLCILCGECVRICPVNALDNKTGRVVLSAPDVCTYCARCEAGCPVGAIEIPYLIRSEPSLEEKTNHANGKTR